jgi:colicin import membrane protein
MIERVLETATGWKAYDPEAAHASEHIRGQVQARYGIDVNNTGADEVSVSEALTRAQQARTEAENERTKASAARADEVVARAAVAGANRQDKAAQKAQDEPGYDSADRRQQLAGSLEGKGDREAVSSRLLADKHQGTPATAAVAQKPSPSKTSKMAKQVGKGRTLERGGLER